MKIGNYEIGILNSLLVFIPIILILQFAHAEGTWIFIASVLAVIPLAGVLGEATEHIAEHVGPGVGGMKHKTQNFNAMAAGRKQPKILLKLLTGDVR
jgi:Ca2+/H+ antiporter